jgi:uncharacterized membrane protein (UPF0127 family)
MKSEEFQLVERRSGRIVVPRLRLATTAWQRLKGLQFRRTIAADAGLLLAPCNSVHTCFVFFRLDVAMLDEAGTVLAVHRNVRPWRAIFPIRGATFVLEARTGSDFVSPGDQLVIAETPPEELPRVVAPLASSRTD